jgi:hypothetical protein
MAEKAVPEFKIGDRVEWSSQSQGSRLVKRGVVVKIVEAGAPPPEEWKSNLPRKVRSYVIGEVEAQRYEKKGGEVKKVFKKTSQTYWPVPSLLKLRAK